MSFAAKRGKTWRFDDIGTFVQCKNREVLGVARGRGHKGGFSEQRRMIEHLLRCFKELGTKHSCWPKFDKDLAEDWKYWKSGKAMTKMKYAERHDSLLLIFYSFNSFSLVCFRLTYVMAPEDLCGLLVLRCTTVAPFLDAFFKSTQSTSDVFSHLKLFDLKRLTRALQDLENAADSADTNDTNVHAIRSILDIIEFEVSRCN